MTVRQLIPEGLDEMVPGPELGVLLAGIDVHALTGADAVEVLRARARQLSHDQARLLATMVEVGLCDPDAGVGEVARLAESPPYAADEIRAALAWTRGAADRELGFAETLVLRMPAVFTALESGRICRSKAWVFADLCADLTAEQADVVCARLLPQATRLTTGELAARIKKLAIALDPQWAARRYATAVRERNVIGYLNADGTATVTGSALPVDAAAVACAHVEELARATKRAGHPGRIGGLRADIYLGLLDGRWQHCNRDQIIADLLIRATSDTDDDADPDDPTDPDQPADPVVGGDAAAGGVCDGAAADGAPGGGTPIHHAAAAGGGGGAGTHQDRTTATGRPGTVPEAAAQPVRRVGVEVRVGLSTLLGRDRHPGEVAGWGPITAEVARSVVVAQRGAEWRYALTDPAGQLLLAGITRRRPHRTAPGNTAGRLPPGRGGIVEYTCPPACSPSSLRTWMPAASGPRWWLTSPSNSESPAGVDRPARTRPPGLPGRRCAAMSRSGIGRVCTRGAAAPPAAPISTTPSTTPTAESPPRATLGRCAGMIIGSSTSAGGVCTSPNPAISPGSAHWGGSTAPSRHRSPTTCPSLDPGPITPTTRCSPPPMTISRSWTDHHLSQTPHRQPSRQTPTSRHPSDISGCTVSPPRRYTRVDQADVAEHLALPSDQGR